MQFSKYCRWKKCQYSHDFKFNPMGLKFETDVRHQAYCCEEHQKLDRAGKVKRKKVYDADKEYFRLKARSHAIGVGLMKLEGVEEICVACEDATKVVELHHKNADWSDNSKTNREYRCKDCHAERHSEMAKEKKESLPLTTKDGFLPANRTELNLVIQMAANDEEVKALREDTDGVFCQHGESPELCDICTPEIV